MTRVRLAVSLAALVACAVAAPAFAAPPSGEYSCFVRSNGSHMGELHLLAKHHYRFGVSNVGLYKVSGHKLKFTSGVFHGEYAGTYSKTRKGLFKILLKPIRSVVPPTYCVQKK